MQYYLNVIEMLKNIGLPEETALMTTESMLPEVFRDEMQDKIKELYKNER